MGTEHVSILEAFSLDESHDSHTLHTPLKRILQLSSVVKDSKQTYFETFFLTNK